MLKAIDMTMIWLATLIVNRWLKTFHTTPHRQAAYLYAAAGLFLVLDLNMSARRYDLPPSVLYGLTTLLIIVVGAFCTRRIARANPDWSQLEWGVTERTAKALRRSSARAGGFMMFLIATQLIAGILLASSGSWPMARIEMVRATWAFLCNLASYVFCVIPPKPSAPPISLTMFEDSE